MNMSDRHQDQSPISCSKSQSLIKILSLLLVLARILTRAKPSKYESVAIVGTHHAMLISWRKVLAIICNCVACIVHSICWQLVTLFANA